MVIVDVLVKMRSYWSRVDPYSNMIVFLIKRETWTQGDLHTGRTVCKDEGRYWGDAAESKEHQKLPANH